MTRVVPLLALLAAGCGGGSSSAPTGKSTYSYYDYGTVGEFKDDAPANAKPAAKDVPMAFIDHAGKPVDLAPYKGKKNVVLVILRGFPQSPGGVFCPNCLAQTKGLSTSRADFEKRDAEVLLVYPGAADRVTEFMDQAKADAPKLPFTMLLDKNLAVCDQLGIRGDLAKPSTYILDKKGDVVYAYVGQTTVDRPSTKAILAQLDKLK